MAYYYLRKWVVKSNRLSQNYLFFFAVICVGKGRGWISLFLTFLLRELGVIVVSL